MKPFEVGRNLVTNGKFFEFVVSGGYETPEFWSPLGWQWRQAAIALHPRFWIPCGSDFRYRATFDESVFAADTIRPSEIELATVEAMQRLGNQVVDRADEILARSDERFPVTIPAIPSEVHDFNDRYQSSYASFSQPIERSVAELVRRVTDRTGDQVIDWLAHNQACWVQDLAFRQARRAEWLQNSCQAFEAHLRIMRACREQTASLIGANIAEQNRTITSYLGDIVREKLRVSGVVPELRIFHDFDDSLTVDFDNYKHEIPLRNLMTLSRRCLAAGELRRARARMSLLAGLMSLPSQARLLRRQLQRTVGATTMFSNAMHLLNTPNEKVQHRILSANFGCHVRANLAARVSRRLEVTALEANSYRGPEKELCLLESVMMNPDAIHVIVDDGDNRLVGAVNRSESETSESMTPPLEDLAVICSRVGNGDSKSYALRDALAAREILHGVNQTNYEAVTSIVALMGDACWHEDTSWTR